MISDPKIGDQVSLRSDSNWRDKGSNPTSGTAGNIIGIEGHWLEVLWEGHQEPINYKAYDLDAVV